MPQVIEQHKQIIIHICLCEVIWSPFEVLDSFRDVITVIDYGSFRILCEMEFLDKKRNAVTVFRYGKYLLVNDC